MNFPSSLKRFLADERGVGSVFMIATLPIFLTLAGMAIDGAAAFGTRTELQAAADSAALASAQDLSAKGSAVAIQTAVTYAQKNMPVAKDGNVLATSDVQTGNWNSTTRTFTANATALDQQQQRTADHSSRADRHTELEHRRAVGGDDDIGQAAGVARARQFGIDVRAGQN